MKWAEGMRTVTEELRIFVKWSEFLSWLLNTTERFPRKARFNFTTRLDNLALDVLEDIIVCRYDTAYRYATLKQLNIRLEKLRILMRICHERMYLSPKQFEYSITKLNEVGNMVGGWLKRTAEGAGGA